MKVHEIVWELSDKKNYYNLAKGLRIKYGKGGYETQEKPRLSTGGRGVQA